MVARVRLKKHTLSFFAPISAAEHHLTTLLGRIMYCGVCEFKERWRDCMIQDALKVTNHLLVLGDVACSSWLVKCVKEAWGTSNSVCSASPLTGSPVSSSSCSSSEASSSGTASDVSFIFQDAGVVVPLFVTRIVEAFFYEKAAYLTIPPKGVYVALEKVDARSAF